MMTKRIFGALALLALVGCSGETGLRLVVRTDIEVPGDMDSVRVTVFAGAGSTELFVRTQSFGDLTADSFPVTVGVTSGSSYDQWVMFRVEGLLGSSLVVERWVVGQFVEGEIRELVIELQSSCLLTACDGGQECRDGACATAERPGGWTIDCGDGVPDTGEECDDGEEGNSDTAPDACRTNCTAAACGDTVVDTGEQCDDGNTTSGDGCSAACRTEGASCGDGEVNGTEECDDGNATAGDGCEADCTFSCHAAADCNDDDQCTVDTCDVVTDGRICHNVIDDGAACDDGNPCTVGEACDAAGACTGGTNECECDPEATDTCEDDHGDDEPCNGTLVCSAAGECVVDDATVLEVGDPCGNGIFCDGVDLCAGDPIACASPGDPCADCQTCDEEADECDIDAGFCFIDDSCYDDADPNPTNGCEACDADVLATGWTDVADGTTCDDGDACTEGEICTGGVCGGGTDICTCDPSDDTCEADHGDGDPCNGTLSCSGTTLLCVLGAPLAVDDPCDDGLACNGADTCQNPGTGIACTHAGSPCRSCETCAEGTPTHSCTLNTGFCILGTPADCVARGTTNTTNVCEVCDDTESTTTWTPNAGAACDDGEFCNGTDTCESDATCSRHASPPCSATCHSGCVEATDTCTIAAGSCYIGAACYADDAPNPANECQFCDAGASQTAWTDRAAGTPCTADADGCTIDACSGGACGHTAECVDSTVAVDAASTSWRFCVTDANCLSGSCTAVNVPGSWNSWATDGTPMTHCAAGGGFWVAEVTGLTTGNQCYRFYGTDGTTPAWFSDPAAGSDCGTGADYCSPATDTNCRVVVP
ncbi:MAG: hypothetical protein JXB32_05080 [Deltaproteobacteria bacterium]|nr:hypothetical protein [Deltaproteobacteria bacterium]